MTHVSPAALLTWSVMSTMMLAFFVGHLWKFDRFKCLKWESGPYTGAFKRFMTYTYLLTIPFLMTYSYGYTYIKYMEGYSDIPGLGIVPTPYTLWPEKYQRAIFPLNLLFSFAWSLEMITHLEELCFWLFLVTAGPSQIYWFKSIYFRVWILGSILALVYVPVIAITTRANPLQCEANIFLAGSLGDLVLTVAFIPILWSFPAFLNKIKREGVNGEVMVRLRTFYEMNVTRIIFRSIFVGSTLALGIDGVRGHVHHLNEIPFWTDIFVIAAAIGCAISSALTVLIFFPRSFGDEYEAYHASNQIATQPSNSKLRRGHGRAYPHPEPHATSRSHLSVSFKQTSSDPHSSSLPQTRGRANSSSTVITGKPTSPRLGGYGFGHGDRGYVPGHAYALGNGEAGSVEEFDMAKFTRSPTKEHGASNTFLLTDTPVRGVQALPQEYVLGGDVLAAHIQTEADITSPPLFPPLSPLSPLTGDSFHPISTIASANPSTETDYDFDRHSQPPLQRTWRVHNRVPGVDDVGTVTQSSTARERERARGENGIERSGSGSVVSFDSVTKTYATDAEEGRANTRTGMRTKTRTKRLSHGKAIGDRLTHDNLQWHTAHSSKINPLIYRFMSPIDFMEEPDPHASRRQSLQYAYAV